MRVLIEVINMLTERQLLILQIIVDDFIRMAQPVGSRSLSKKEGISFSSATIRNEMADLEELGYIEKPHSSAGRIPSEKGYRFYVDHLLSPQPIEETDLQSIKGIFDERIFEMEKIVKNSAEILSDLTNYTTIALGPKLNQNKLQSIQLIPIGPNKAVSIIVTNTGIVQNKTVTLPDGVSMSDIEKMIAILNERLVGVPIQELNDKLFKEVAILLRHHITNYDSMLKMMGKTLEIPFEQKMFLSGKTNILAQPEFHDVETMKTLFSMIERKDELQRLLPKNQAGLIVKIGKENEKIGLNNISIISASYSLGNNQLGTIAVLGPTRMEYSRVIALMQMITSQINNLISPKD